MSNLPKTYTDASPVRVRRDAGIPDGDDGSRSSYERYEFRSSEADSFQAEHAGKFRALIEDTCESFTCDRESNLLHSMECLGRKGIPVGCRGGGCGICKVRVTAGSYRTERMSRACVSVEEEAEGYVLACKVFPQSDLSVRVVGGMIRALMHGSSNSSS